MRTSILKPMITGTLITAVYFGTAIAAFAAEKYEGVMGDIPHSIVTFDAGSAQLSDANKNKIREMILQSQAKMEIDRIAIAAWSDKALPKAGKNRSKSDRNLADKRIEAITTYAKAVLSTANIKTYNMAESSNWLARQLKTSDAELKSIFSKKGSEAPVTNAEFQLIKNEGGPSEAVVLVQRKAVM